MHDVSDMVVFVEVVRQGGFSAAGRRLGLATSVVSDRVKGLERRLGVKLLNRTTRTQVLTDGGAIYLEHATQIITDIQAMETSVMAQGNIPRGDLKVTAPGPLGRQHIAPFIGRFCLVHPYIRVHLTLEDRFSDIVGEGYDVAFRGGPVIDSQFAGRLLFESRRVVVASPVYLQRSGVPQTPEDLKNHRCLVFNGESHFYAEWRFGRGVSKRSLRVEGAMASTNSELPVSWALAGLGLTQKSWWEVAPYVSDGLLQTVLDAHEPDPVSFYAIHPVRSAQSRKISLFMEAVTECFKGFGDSVYG
ncbi:LysR family transcriptional regulator [Pseudomonas chlororaphis]|uniref:LysR family transcriptional regulator n=1 Tax=Pseudomonas chlororaphis TaxID=587753 RepID=UPI0039E0E3B6